VCPTETSKNRNQASATTGYVVTVEDSSDPAALRFLPVCTIASSSGASVDGVVVGATAAMQIHDDTQTAAFAASLNVPSKVTVNCVAELDFPVVTGPGVH